MFEPESCPNPDCAQHHDQPRKRSPRNRARFYTRKGSFPRANATRVARFLCKVCGRHFSEQTFRATYRAKKPELDARVEELRLSGLSQRAASRLLRISRQTVARRYRAAERALSGTLAVRQGPQPSPDSSATNMSLPSRDEEPEPRPS